MKRPIAALLHFVPRSTTKVYEGRKDSTYCTVLSCTVCFVVGKKDTILLLVHVRISSYFRVFLRTTVNFLYLRLCCPLEKPLVAIVTWGLRLHQIITRSGLALMPGIDAINITRGLERFVLSAGLGLLLDDGFWFEFPPTPELPPQLFSRCRARERARERDNWHKRHTDTEREERTRKRKREAAGRFASTASQSINHTPSALTAAALLSYPASLVY
jgi:hypothetical protein